MPHPSRHTAKRRLLTAAAVLLAVLLAAGAAGYGLFTGSITDRDSVVCIPENTSFEALCDTLSAEGRITRPGRFRIVARAMGADRKIRSGRYELHAGMSAHRIVSMLRSGSQTPLRVTFNNIRTMPQLASVLGRQPPRRLRRFRRHAAGRLRGRPLRFPAGGVHRHVHSRHVRSLLDGITRRLRRTHEQGVPPLLERYAAGRSAPHWTYGKGSGDTRFHHRRGDQPDGRNAGHGGRLYQPPTPRHTPAGRPHGTLCNRRFHSEAHPQPTPESRFAVQHLPACRIASGTDTHALRGSHRCSARLCGTRLSRLLCARPDFSGYHAFARTLAEHNRNARAYAAALDRRGIR